MHLKSFIFIELFNFGGQVSLAETSHLNMWQNVKIYVDLKVSRYIHMTVSKDYDTLVANYLHGKSEREKETY